MRSFLKLAAALFLALPLESALADAKDTKEKDTKEKDAKKQAAKKSEKGEGKKTSGEKKPDLDVPVEPGHDAKGLKIPYFDVDGKLQMTFTIGVASRLDEERVQMTNLQVETFSEGGESEMEIDLPVAILNLTTSVVSSKEHVTIRRADFELTGETMDYDTKAKRGTLAGGVRMLIYDLENEMTETTKPKTP